MIRGPRLCNFVFYNEMNVEVGGWVEVSLEKKENSPLLLLIFGGRIPYMCILFAHRMKS